MFTELSTNIKVKYNYIACKQDTGKEAVCNKVCYKAGNLIELPDTIYIEIKLIDKQILGETILDLRSYNKITLNSLLTIKECVLVLTHELIHLSQIHKKQLTLHKNGNYVWEGKEYINLAKLKTLAYYDYLQLPWEQDVVEKQQNLLENLLKI